MRYVYKIQKFFNVFILIYYLFDLDITFKNCGNVVVSFSLISTFSNAFPLSLKNLLANSGVTSA